MEGCMNLSKPLRYTLFGLLYFTQGTILSYFTALNALYFLSRGLTMTSVGIFSAIALIPFVVKIFLGMLSDHTNLLGLGYRKPYILIGLAIQVICLIIAPFIDLKTAYWGFVFLAFMLQMGMALYDTCTDGLALDSTPLEEQGTIQGFMVGGRAVGVIVTASVVGILAEKASWYAVFWLLAVLTLLPLPLVLKLREAERPAQRRFEWRAFAAFKNRLVWLVAAAGLISFMVIVGANQLVNPFVTEALQVDLSTAGLLTTFWGIGVVAGGFAGGKISARLGLPRAILIAVLASTVSLGLLAWLIQPSAAQLTAFVLVTVFGLTYGIYQTSMFALAMRYTDPAIAASMFAILMAFTNIGQAIGLGWGGAASDAIGFPWTFTLFAGLNLLVLPFIARLKMDQQPAAVSA
jgi:PAT family beta-lactamase induction signal transducer AmpG